MKRFMYLGSLTIVAFSSAPMAAYANVENGITAWERGDYQTAVTQWRPLAAKGDADAQFNLAQAYRLGRGCEQNMKTAESWYGKAARQGHPGAEDNYGLALFQNGKRDAAMPWIEKSAARGDARAQYVLGTAHFNGDLAEKDWVRAYALMTRSAAAGFPKGIAALADMDKYIPLDQRQQGIAMARDLELKAMRPQIASAGGRPIVVTEIPPSVSAQKTGAGYPEPGQKAVPRQSRPVGKSIVAPSPKAEPKITPAPIVVKPVKAAAVTPAPKPQPTGPAWRIQLGAFGDPANAKSLWSSLQRKVSGLADAQPYLVTVKGANVTRLQAGPFASKAAAEKQCATIKATGQACLIVAP